LAAAGTLAHNAQPLRPKAVRGNAREPIMNATVLDEDARIAARNRLVINLLLVSSFVVILNETIMSVAIPRLMESLGVTAAAAQWVTTGFLLTMAVVIPMTGFLLHRLPLFTVSLSSVPPQLYSHGSAVLGSLQQVAGAAGVALFIAIMSAQSAKLAAGGAVAVEALAGGIRAAFLAGAVGALCAVTCSFLVRRPDATAPHAAR
jgi:MFS family permease